MNTHNLNLKELNPSDLRKTYGGTFNFFAYAMGYVVGTVEAIIVGAYESGYDAAQNNCECD